MIFRKLMLSVDLNFESEDRNQLKEIISSKNEDYTTEKVKAAVQALLLCHNVTPVLDNSKRCLQGSSPDELTLVSFA
jgi:magnesium-transporting ATPase (P-type)